MPLPGSMTPQATLTLTETSRVTIDIVWLPRFLHGLKEDNLREKADLAEDSGGEGMQDSEHFLDKFKKFLGTWNWWQWYNFTELFLETYLKSTIITCHFTIYWQLDPRFWKSFLM